MTVEIAMLIEIQIEEIAFNFWNMFVLLGMGVFSGIIAAVYSVKPLKNVQIADIGR